MSMTMIPKITIPKSVFKPLAQFKEELKKEEDARRRSNDIRFIKNCSESYWEYELEDIKERLNDYTPLDQKIANELSLRFGFTSRPSELLNNDDIEWATALAYQKREFENDLQKYQRTIRQKVQCAKPESKEVAVVASHKLLKAIKHVLKNDNKLVKEKLYHQRQIGCVSLTFIGRLIVVKGTGDVVGYAVTKKCSSLSSALKLIIREREVKDILSIVVRREAAKNKGVSKKDKRAENTVICLSKEGLSIVVKDSIGVSIIPIIDGSLKNGVYCNGN